MFLFSVRPKSESNTDANVKPYSVAQEPYAHYTIAPVSRLDKRCNYHATLSVVVEMQPGMDIRKNI